MSDSKENVVRRYEVRGYIHGSESFVEFYEDTRESVMYQITPKIGDRFIRSEDFDRLAAHCAELEKSPEIVAQLEDEKRVLAERCAEMDELLGRCAQQVKRFRALQTAYGVNDEKVSALLRELEPT